MSADIIPFHYRKPAKVRARHPDETLQERAKRLLTPCDKPTQPEPPEAA